MTDEREQTRKRGRPRTRLPMIERLPGETDSVYLKRCAKEYERRANEAARKEAWQYEKDNNHKKCVVGGYVLSEIQRLRAEQDPSGPQLAKLRDLLKLVEDGVTREGDRSRYFSTELAAYRDLPSSISAVDVQRAEAIGRIFLTAIKTEWEEKNNKREFFLLKYIERFKRQEDEAVLGDLLERREMLLAELNQENR
ncbi:hypothetical protein [Azospirillum brasilense]|uniref:hypothetical protein n=1 Tax=Azospirillum brasilense TaxID=192 RepID=UPI001EDB5FE1|nr:hypothetical protein [Azospirillum brasilense]UKJ75959.1 hypothetical protein H1Q64_17235 [Azospirillum brasilense]